MAVRVEERGLREGRGVGYEGVVRDMKRSCRKVSDRAVPCEYKVCKQLREMLQTTSQP